MAICGVPWLSDPSQDSLPSLLRTAMVCPLNA